VGRSAPIGHRSDRCRRVYGRIGSSGKSNDFRKTLQEQLPNSPKLRRTLLGHWEVENCLHGVKDKEYAEDKHVLGRNSWGKTWTVLTNIAVSLTNLMHKGERTLREVREMCAHNPRNTARKLGWKT